MSQSSTPRRASVLIGVCAGLLFTQPASADLTVTTEWERTPSSEPSGFSPGDWQITTVWGSGASDATPWPAPATISFGEPNEGYREMTLFIPNWVDNMPRKFIRGSIYTGSSVDLEALGLHGQNDGQDVGGTLSLTRDPTDELRWGISGRFDDANPDWEILTIKVPIHPSLGNPITSMYIETESIPAPGTLAMIGLAGLTAARRRQT